MDSLWYVSYGSNLFADRFTCYLAGGRAPGARWTNPGARDASPPSGDRRVDLDHALVFGGPSHTWHGGPAFLDLVTPGRSVGRGWRITREQFADVVAQENKLDPGVVIVTDRLLDEGGIVLPGARYGRLVPLDPIDGEPAATFTYIDRPRERAPDPRYLELLEAGLQELGLAAGEACAVLHSQPQLAADHGSRADLARALRDRAALTSRASATRTSTPGRSAT